MIYTLILQLKFSLATENQVPFGAQTSMRTILNVCQLCHDEIRTLHAEKPKNYELNMQLFIKFLRMKKLRENLVYIYENLAKNKEKSNIEDKLSLIAEFVFSANKYDLIAQIIKRRLQNTSTDPICNGKTPIQGLIKSLKQKPS